MSQLSSQHLSGWKSGRLGDFITLKRGYDLPKHQRAPGPFPVISSSGIVDHHSVAMVQGPGVVTGRYGTLGDVFYVTTDFWPLNTALYVSDFKGNDPRFVNYFLRTFDFFAYSDKAAVPGINRNHVHEAAVTFPDEMEQGAIASILGGLDDKIELNQNISATLEAMARALFKSWFVDFDPVRAKAEGRDPRLSTEIADLFTNLFENSALGEIPHGWACRAISEVAELTKGKSYRSADLRESDAALVTLKSFARGGGYRREGLKTYSGDYKATQVVRPGDLIVACTDVTQAAEVIGRPALVQSDDSYETLIASLDVMIVRPIEKASTVSIQFLYCLFQTERFVAHVHAHTTGTTVLHLSNEALPSYIFAMPPAAIVRAFSDLAEPIFSRILMASAESQTLSRLRDALLPKLISGEIRVAEAERIVAKSA